MIDPLKDELIPLQQVPDLLPKENGRKKHIRTIFRWVHHGLQGRKLRTVRIGGRHYTTADALNAFFLGDTQKVAEGARSQSDTTRSSRSARSRREQARDRARDIIAGGNRNGQR